MIELDRGDGQYKEIESFEDYEISQCIVFEMAIRTPKYRYQVDEVIKYYNENQQDIDSYDINQEIDGNKIDKYYKLLHMIDDIIRISLQDIDDELDYESAKFFGEDFNRVVKIVIKKFAYNQTQKSNATTYKHYQGLDTVVISDEVERDGYSIYTHISANDNYALIPLDDGDHKEVKTVDDFYEYLQHEDSNRDDVEYTRIIQERFKRPRLNLDERIATQTSIMLDLNKPLNELISYITLIKKDTNMDQKILKAPIELFGEELQRADNISKMCTKTKNGVELCFDSRKGITISQKIADMFFVYDALKQGAKELNIRTEISSYYITIGRQTEMSDKTFRKYRDIATDYIENERYQELITGIKS